ncbi:MAG: HDOD domain-containing protein [Gammaproteobacteria bacterium]|nr:HDOD domain-containing protein [Gammaproteobacteria bacterium]MBT4861749.1 HDOD domain-containing protein [Gammaproteobacteria bacterium]
MRARLNSSNTLFNNNSKAFSYTPQNTKNIIAVTDFDFPKKIDRFIIKDILGKGAQGVVYLATDPSLDRQVAIKSVTLRTRLSQQDNIENLLQEARTVSQLQHPNIVTIYDVGNDPLEPYLVLEYVKGETLYTQLKNQIPLQQSFNIIRDVLSGVTAAHNEGIIHCDLKPANIMITKKGQAKVADFGLALLADTQHEGNDSLAGTPQYMAPEYIETHKHQTVSDVFSLGLIFYELLTGQKAVDGDDVYQILNAIANTPIPEPSSKNSNVDENMDAFIMKALEKNPENRYKTAGEMLSAFEDNLALKDAMNHSDTSDSTVQFLLRRMSHKKDFPAFSRTISILNKASNSETESLSTVSNAILKDISLTNKVLRIVNSAYYSRGGGKISTISRAVVMLGINPVKSLAVSLMLFEHLQNKMQASQLMEDAVTSLFSAIMANDLAHSNKVKEHEEAFLCALLQQLGKLLVRFYLHEESQAIDKQVEQNNQEENTAALKVLGTSYHALGMAVAREWGFPEQIINSMKPVEESDPLLKKKPEKSVDKLRVIANFSNNLSHVLKQPKEQQDKAIESISKQYNEALSIDDKKITKLIETSQKELTSFAKLINFNLNKSKFYQQLTSDTDDKSVSENGQAKSDFNNNGNMQVLEEDTSLETIQSSEKALTDGIQDITNTLTGDNVSINQIMQMILETIYRALSGSRVLLGLRDKASNSIKGKFGYGEDIEELIQSFRIPLAYEADVFHIAFKNNVDIKIEDTQDSKIKSKIPGWYHQKIGAKSFVLFPIVIKHSPIAMIYIDSTQAKSISISDSQLSLLKTLRNQAILAIKSI